MTTIERNTKRYHRMVTSTYDLHNLCNLKCEGCSYFVSERASKTTQPSHADYDRFFAQEVARGVTYPIFSGAEPSLNQSALHVAARHWSHGAVFTNGIKAIDADLPFRVVISLWGGRANSAKIRGANTYERAMKSARDDRRSIIFYTITRLSIENIMEVIEDCSANAVQVSFNFFSMTAEYRKKLETNFANDNAFFRFSNPTTNLSLDADDRRLAVELIELGMKRRPDTVLFTPSLARFMAEPGDLHAIDPSTGLASNCAVLASRTHLSYNYDLTRDERKDCCAPDLDCRDCRVLGAALGTLIAHKSEAYRRTRLGGQDLMELWDLMMRLYYWDWGSDRAVG